MKKYKNLSGLIAFFILALFAIPVVAQDDLYYNPPSDNTTPSTEKYEGSNVTRTFSNDDDDEYFEEDDYDYQYSSRIRRFHRRAIVYDYYDPFFTDLYFYDPFFAPGASIYVMGYNDYWRWRRWNRWNRHNAWAWGWNDPFFFGSSWGYRPGWGGWGAWNNVYVYNNYFYDPYWTWNGFNPYYCPSNVWVNNNYYFNNTGNNGGSGGYQPQTYVGPRRNGTNINPGYAALPGGGRLKAAETPADAERTLRPNGRTIVSDKEPAAADRSGRTSASNPTRTPASDVPASQPTGTGRQPSRQPEIGTQPSRSAEETRPQRREVEDARPSRRNTDEIRPNRGASEDARPARRTEESRPSRNSEELSPSRRTEEVRPNRRNESNDGGSRPNRSFDTPSRNNSSSPSMNKGSSGGSNSGGGSRGSGSSGGGGSRSGGGSRGHN